MTNIRKLASVFSIFVVLSLSSVLVFAPNTSAVPQEIQFSNDIVLGTINATRDCEPINLNTSIYNFLEENLSNAYPSEWTIFNDNLNLGGSWGIFSVYDEVPSSPYYGEPIGISFYLYADPNVNLEVSYDVPSGVPRINDPGNSSLVYSFGFSQNANDNCEIITSKYNNVSASQRIRLDRATVANGTNGTGVVNYISTINPITYPEDYVGEVIPSGLEEEPSNQDIIGQGFQPSFKIAWDDYDVTLNDTTPFDKVDEFGIDKCYWQISDSSWSVINATAEYDCSERVPYEITLPEYGNYSVQLTYYDEDDYKLYSSSSQLNLDGGSGSDSINDPFYSTAIGRVFEKHQATDYGLQKFFLAPIEFVASLPSKMDNCSTIVIPFLGDNITFPCVKNVISNSPIGSIVPIYQTIVLAVVTYAVAINIMGVIKSATNPLDDKIEVLKL